MSENGPSSSQQRAQGSSSRLICLLSTADHFARIYIYKYSLCPGRSNFPKALFRPVSVKWFQFVWINVLMTVGSLYVRMNPRQEKSSWGGRARLTIRFIVEGGALHYERHAFRKLWTVITVKSFTEGKRFSSSPAYKSEVITNRTGGNWKNNRRVYLEYLWLRVNAYEVGPIST